MRRDGSSTEISGMKAVILRHDGTIHEAGENKYNISELSDNTVKKAN